MGEFILRHKHDSIFYSNSQYNTFNHPEMVWPEGSCLYRALKVKNHAGRL